MRQRHASHMLALVGVDLKVAAKKSCSVRGLPSSTGTKGS